MDVFSFIKECLLTHNYPLVHSMSEDEIADIFKASNRCFLVSWMLKLLDDAYKDIIENRENDKELLSSLVHELGFCSKKDKLFFIKGELPVAEQVKIIFNMFSFIMDTKKSKDEESRPAVSSEELTALVNIDLNLFPMYGDIKLLKPDKRIELSEIEKDMNALKIGSASEIKSETIHLFDETFKRDIQEFLEKLKLDFPRIKSAMDDAIRNGDIEMNSVIELKPNSIDTIRKCCKNLKIVSQFIKDINTIEDFEKQNIRLNEENGNNKDVHDMIKALHIEVSTVLKYSRCL